MNWEHHFHFLYWMTHLRYTTGIPFSHDHGMIMSKISAKFRIISGMGLMGYVKQQTNTWSVASTPFRHPAKFSGERRNCGGFLGHGGIMGVSKSSGYINHQRLGYPHDYGNLNPFGTTSARTLPLAQETGHRAANRRRH